MTDDACDTKITLINHEMRRVLRVLLRPMGRIGSGSVSWKSLRGPWIPWAPTEDPMPRPFQDLPPQTEVGHRSVSIPLRSLQNSAKSRNMLFRFGVGVSTSDAPFMSFYVGSAVLIHQYQCQQAVKSFVTSPVLVFNLQQCNGNYGNV